MKKALEIFGWYGAIAILLAYALVSFSLLESNNIWYQLLNLTGAFGIASISLYKKTYQPAVVNTIWLIIALIAVFKIVF